MGKTTEAMHKATAFVRKLKAADLPKQGWTGSFWDVEDTPAGQVVLECARAGDGEKTVDETILLAWEGAIYIKGVYRVYDGEKAVKNAAEALRIMGQSPARIQQGAKKARMTGKSRAGRAAPDFSVMTDQEVVDALAGQTVTFRRSLDGAEETVTLPPKVSERDDGKRRKNDINVTRTINFCGGPPGYTAFRSVRIQNIISIS